MTETDVERLENMSPIGVDHDGNLLVKHGDWFWLQEQAEQAQGSASEEVRNMGNCKRMKELSINSQGILKIDTIGLSGPCAIVISKGKAKIVDLPLHADVKITTYKGRVTRINWDEGEPF